MTSINTTISNLNNQTTTSLNNPIITSETSKKTQEVANNTSITVSNDQKKLSGKIKKIHELNKSLIIAENQSTLNKIFNIAFFILFSGALAFAATAMWPVSVALAVFIFIGSVGYGAAALYLALKPQILQYRLEQNKEQLKQWALLDPEKATLIKLELTQKIIKLEEILAQDFSMLGKPYNRTPYQEAIKSIREWEVANGEVSLALYQNLLKLL